MRLFWQIIVLSAVLLEAGKERALAASNAAVNDNGSPGHQASLSATTTKTVYGFLDFTTIVSDTMMIFKPSKAAGNKARNAFGSQRTASVLLNKSNKPAAIGNRAKIEADQPVLEASATVQLTDGADEHQPHARSGSVQGSGRFKPGRPRTSTPSEVHIEGSLVNFEEASTQATPRSKTSLTERLKIPRRQTTVEAKAPDSVVPLYSVIKSHVDVSSRVDIHIGGLPKVEVRMEMNMSPPAKRSSSVANVLPPGQSLVSRTVGTRIQNGLTTIHETSVIGTTIDGQYAHFVQSTSTVFQEPTATVSAFAPGRSGSVEVVTDNVVTVSVAKPKNNKQSSGGNSASKPSTDADDLAHFASLPSLESLFKSVSTPAPTKADEELPKAESEEVVKKTPDVNVQEDSPSVVIHKSSPSSVPKPSTSPSGNLERRAGLASSLRIRDTTPRPQRPDEQRWRYSPTPKPKVSIQRTSNASGSRFRERVTNQNNQPSRDGEFEDHSGSNNNYQEPESPDPTEVITLRVQSVTPEGYSNIYYEIATVKSPYIMRLGAVRNTRYVTLTRSYTRLITPTPPPAVVATVDDSDYSLPDYEPEALLEPSQPLPDPENIIGTTTPYEQILKESSDTATLPAIIVAATEVTNDYTMQTVTETFSTTELMLKTSILPYQRAGTTSHMTLTQSYYITRVVVAVKTVPPEDLYRFIPSKTLTDISTNLQEAGSEHNERLLPGELEFSENDEYSDQEDDGPRNEKRVPPPKGYSSDADLSSIGQEFDLSSVDRPSPQVDLEPSLVDTAAEFTTRLSTPPLPNSFQQLEPSINGNVPQPLPSGQETPVLSPEQLQQLALFRYMNPYAAAGLPFGYPGLPGYGAGNVGGGTQVITTSKPVVKTLDVIRTETVPIWNGVTTIYSTITRTKGTTVVTETEYGTATITAPVNPLFPGQQYTIVSSPVVTEVTTTSTELRIYRIIFRAQTTYTTVTSTTVFPTMVTTYVSSTVPIQPTAFPAGLFPGSYPFAAFG
uniref:EOG090X017N n=1 Tax=Daphnia lumholtzi TaxID=42856 RepID=A0A4Y7MAA6_9CRUS|nr:EOG090X017N [Daphnia lumholtzi]SVE77439.1 EOG090X017N [Daphnia lumholtzi]SVE78069.1 EOG090X017N [Daphnia lumholtzi]SVE78697.1 EOG090X017N [Daphnia lumholtzi]